MELVTSSMVFLLMIRDQLQETSIGRYTMANDIIDQALESLGSHEAGLSAMQNSKAMHWFLTLLSAGGRGGGPVSSLQEMVTAMHRAKTTDLGQEQALTPDERARALPLLKSIVDEEQKSQATAAVPAEGEPPTA